MNKNRPGIWKIAPANKWLFYSVAEQLRNKFPKFNSQGRTYDISRLIKIESQLKPTSCYAGQNNFEGYIVYHFEWTRKIVLESPFFGNATYVINRDYWHYISKGSKSTARNKSSNKVTVIPHNNFWFANLKTALRETGQRLNIP